jgi:isopentenyl diphosphate isomerase/L-lactate dehydrogenase-like FMN-dependent dehydrogenase
MTVDSQAPEYERRLHNRNLGGVVRRGGRSSRDADATPVAVSGDPITPTFPETNRYGAGNRQQWYNWGYINALRESVIRVPLVIKGVLTVESALECVSQGVDAIIVSNHGGRSMDYAPSTLEVLPEIVAAVNGRIPVIVDSGFRRGSDVFKALALGASAVELGRAPRWGLGAFGAEGVQRLLEIVQEELLLAAASAGRSTLAAIDETAVTTRFV